MSPFGPVGHVARWRSAYRLIEEARVGDTVTFVAFADLMGIDPDTRRAAIQEAVRGALPVVERELNRTVRAVPNLGYRVVEPDAHLDLARHHLGKSGRSAGRARSKVDHVDLNKVTPGLRPLFVALRDFASSVEARLAEMGRGHHDHEQRLAVLERRLGVRKPQTVDGQLVDD